MIACFGDSITDGTLSTLNGDDRWPDVLSRRLHAVHGDRVSVVNAGIGGNRITGPHPTRPETPFAGGPSAIDRLDRDVLSLSGAVGDRLAGRHQRPGAGRVGRRGDRRHARGRAARAGAGGITLIAATTDLQRRQHHAHGTPGCRGAAAGGQHLHSDERHASTGVADFDAATRDDQTGGLRAAFVPNSTIGGPGDRLHPNRAGYLAMGQAVDLAVLAPLFAKR